MTRYALIIGIAEYTGSFKSLETPVQNANAIADILDQYGDFDQVKRLPFRREAGQKDLGRVIRKPLPSEDLVRELQQFLQDADGSDVLIYYSGHGFTKLDPLSHTPEGYLASSDCQVELDVAGQIRTEKNGISLFGLNALINQHTFSSLVVILDCCNSGAFLESSMVRRDVTAFGYQRDYYLITACRSSSKAYEGEEYSLLTAAVLKGLSPGNASPASGRISGDRLFDVIGNELRNSRQEPIRLGWGRLITLVRYLQAPESAESVVHPFNAANPYMGLKPFEREQAAYFFGREQVVRALLDRLAINRFLAVIGPSGCGKSSLVKAGLLVELESDRIPGSSEWQVEIITPGQYPLQALTNALERHHSDDKPVVLFVDQFEELFTLCLNEEEQRAFIKRLNEETNDPAKQTRIIVAMRGDFLDRCAKFQEAADLINSTAPTTYMVIPLTEAKLVGELEDSITCPAALHGVSFEDGLVSRIRDDVINQPGAMPLLQYALLQLWESCISPDGASRLLTIQSYDAIEGVKGALQRWADQFYNNLSSTDQTFVQEMISELVQIGDGGEVTRRRAAWERLRAIASSQEQLDRIIGRLVYQRLLVADDKTVEVAHEALLSESKLIQGWIEENRENIRLQQRLEIYRREWEERDRSENYLLDAGRLAAIDEWMEKKQPRLMSVDQEFIERSREKRDRLFQAQLEQERRLREAAEAATLSEIEKKLEAEARAEAEAEKVKESVARVRAERQRGRITIVAGVLAIFSLGFGLLAQLKQGQIAEEQAQKSRTLISGAQQLFITHNNLEALIACVETLKAFQVMGRSNLRELQDIRELMSKIYERNRVVRHQGSVNEIAFSPNGKLLASAGFDHIINVWDIENNTTVFSKKAHDLEEAIMALRFSRNGKFLASASRDKTIKVWNMEGSEVRNLTHEDEVFDVSFDAETEKLAASGKGNVISVWDSGSNKPRTLMIGTHFDQDSSIYGVDFHPTKQSVLVSTGFKGYDIAIWDLNQVDSKPKLIGKNEFRVFSVRFSQDGTMIVSCDDGGAIKIWKSSGELIGSVIDGEIGMIYAEFSPDGQLVAAVNNSGKVKIWSVSEIVEKRNQNTDKTQKPLYQLEASSGVMTRVKFMSNQSRSPTKTQTLASAGDDGIIRIWQIGSEELLSLKNRTLNDLLLVGCKILIEYREADLEISNRIKKTCD